ncbi:MAG: hypothetical protein RR394_10250 [Oscillospiraceae bacterium]
MWEYLIPALAGVIVAIIELRGARERKLAAKEAARTEMRASQRAEESRLSMELMSASCKLGVVTAKALTHQHVNGDVEEAMNAAEKAQTEYDKFLRGIAAAQAVKI